MKTLEGIDVGDGIAIEVTGGYQSTPYLIGQVTKTTKTQITVLIKGKEQKFSRKTGREIGNANSWHPDRIAETIEGAVLSVEDALERNKRIEKVLRRKQRINLVLSVSRDKVTLLSDDTLEQIIKLLNLE